MLHSAGRNSLQPAIALAGGLILAASAGAQVVLDGSMGAAGALAGPNYTISAAAGKQSGGNLFHSFSRFDVGTGESATFSGPASVANIIGRVTGSGASHIDGAIRSTIAGANLYLINPQGIAFGANASLDVSGAFHASSADYLKLADGQRFSATDPSASTLTSAVPAAFGFLSGNPAGIRIEGASLAGAAGRDITLSGGSVTLTEAAITAPGGRVVLATVAGAAEIALDAADLGLADAAGGTIDIADSLLETDGSGTQAAGAIHIRGGRLALARSTLSARHAGSAASGDIRLVTAQSVALRDGSAVYSRSSGAGAAGAIHVEAPVVTLDGKAWLKSVAASSGAGGAITVKAGRLALADGAHIETTTLAQGTGGGIDIAAGERIDIAGERSYVASVGHGAGAAGDIKLTAPSLAITDGAALSSDVRGSGPGGAIAIDVATLRLADNGVVSVLTEGAGAGGSVDIAAAEIDIAGGKKLAAPYADPVTGLSYAGYYSGIYATSETAISGKAGTVNIRADALRIADGGMISGITLGTGAAGDFSIAVGTLALTGGGLIHTSTSGAGAAGSIAVTASGTVSAGGALDAARYAGFAPRGATTSGIISKATPELNPNAPLLGDGGAIAVHAARLALGDGAEISTGAAKNAAGGTVKLSAQRIELAGGSTVSSASSGSGNAGDITLAARDTLRLKGGSAITTEARSADGGNIDIRAGEMVELRQSRIATAVSKDSGNGGNIFIDPRFVVLDAGSIVATAWAGHGGNIRIEAQNFIASPDSVVDASSQKGVSGSVQITTPNSDVAAGLAAMPGGFFDAASLLRNSCAVRGQAGSSFVAVGRGGLPASPDEVLLARSGLAPPPGGSQGEDPGGRTARPQALTREEGQAWFRNPCNG